MLLLIFVWELSDYIKYCSLPGALDQSEGASKSWVSGFPCGSAPAWTVSLGSCKLDLNRLTMFYVPELSAAFQCQVSCYWMLLSGPHFLCLPLNTVSWGTYAAWKLKSLRIQSSNWAPVCRGLPSQAHFNGLPWPDLLAYICWTPCPS